jgi:dGTPase
VRALYPACEERRLRYSTVRMLFTLQVEDVLSQAAERFAAWQPQSIADVMNAPGRLVAFSPAFQALLKPYRSFLFEKMYFHPEVANAGDHAVRLMTRLFEHYLTHPDDLGEKAKKRLETEGLHRTVCDYVAGCTDRFAFEECQKYQLTDVQL